jgi:PKD repeat protein
MRRSRWFMLVGTLSLLLGAACGCALFNSPPVASFTATPATGEAPLVVYFDASASSDPNANPLTFSWTFGDGATGTGISGFHTYEDPGEYEVTLTVTDSHSEATTMTRTILVTAPENEAPIASFTAAPTSGAATLNVTFNAAASSDPDGTIAGYAWDFGDGDTGTGQNVSHTYTAQGAYIVTLTVTDDDDATDSDTAAILVTAPGNQVPVASFTAEPTLGFVPLAVDFDASASSDPDGTIVLYEWVFGDGDTGVGETTSHTYDTAGTYTAILRVYDDEGALATAIEEIRVLIGPIGPIEPPWLPPWFL